METLCPYMVVVGKDTKSFKNLFISSSQKTCNYLEFYNVFKTKVHEHSMSLTVCFLGYLKGSVKVKEVDSHRSWNPIKIFLI